MISRRRMAASQLFLSGGEGGYVRGGGLFLFTCCVRQVERETERKIHVRECSKDRSVWDSSVSHDSRLTDDNTSQ